MNVFDRILHGFRKPPVRAEETKPPEPTRVIFECPWENPSDGWAIAGRAYARAMKLAGLDVRLGHPQTEFSALDPDVAREIPEEMRVPERWDWDAHLFSCPLGSIEGHQLHRTFELFHRFNLPPRLFYTMFERLNVQPELAAELNRLEGVFVPCKANLRVLEEAGCTNAMWAPIPYFDDDPFRALPTPRDARSFLWVGRWEPRKAPHNIIRAFLRAFQPGDAKLTLKIGPVPWEASEYPEPERVIAEEVERAFWPLSRAVEDITIVRQRLSLREMVGVHAQADVYVSASRGEGIELGSFAAKLAGRRLVVTECGGPVDFLGENDFLVPMTGSLPATDYAWLWGDDARYADYDLDALVLAMQRARSEPLRPERVREVHRAENVGNVLRGWIEERLGGDSKVRP